MISSLQRVAVKIFCFFQKRGGGIVVFFLSYLDNKLHPVGGIVTQAREIPRAFEGTERLD